MTRIPDAEYHSPYELLHNAIEMADSSDPNLMRPSILEAITALEAYVHQTVFDALRGKLDPLLVSWLQEKTRMDFDSRLSILTPVATGLLIDKSSPLWEGYRRAKDIRNKVVHSGRKATEKDAQFVINMVRKWLSYLGSTVGLELELIKIKNLAEKSTRISIENGEEATQLVARYFHPATAASITDKSGTTISTYSHRADLILDFEMHKVLVEAKFVKAGRNVRNVIQNAVAQVDQLRNKANIQKACIVIFVKGHTLGIPDTVERHRDGQIISIAVKLN